MEWYAVSSDQKIPNSDKLFVLWNGDKFVIPVTPTPVAELNTNLSNIEENFDEVKDLIKETIEMLPKSNIKKAFKEVQKMVKIPQIYSNPVRVPQVGQICLSPNFLL